MCSNFTLTFENYSSLRHSRVDPSQTHIYKPGLFALAPAFYHFDIPSLFHTTMSFSNHYGSDLADRNLIRRAVDSLPPNVNGPPPIPLEDLQAHFAILYKATIALKRWKTANENTPPFAEIVFSPVNREYFSVDQAVRQINDEVPPEYRLAKPHSIVYATKRPTKMDKEEWKLFKNGDTDALMKKWDSPSELHVLEEVRRKKLLEAIDVAIGLIETAMITLPFTVCGPYL
ncbi:hypothetical protein IW261DRAFT_1490767 [Armillaria novae-zelandiae]|uniref:Uncharacterized protein n=1 Tax=Armillaria novae-zelandiae TaxID=153914 RepID=A0AA39UF38_9AGAR|nr:hypothetical protein IW261DRAFT_1490767 [Armillaria novae-zelandiae]